MQNARQKVTISLIVAILTFAVAASSHAAIDPPILFVHGFCANSTIWEDITGQLLGFDAGRYGTRVVQLYSDGKNVLRTDGTAFRLSADPSLSAVRLWTVDFYNNEYRTFDPSYVANVDVQYKAGELKRTIDAIKSITGATSVIVVGHSMGGLVARAYAEGLAWALSPNKRVTFLPFQNDVLGTITLDSPHDGADGHPLASAFLGVFGFQECAANPSLNKSQLDPNSKLIATLNSIAIPATTELTSIVSWRGWSDGDGVVTIESQDVKSLEPNATRPNVYDYASAPNVYSVGNEVPVSLLCDNAEYYFGCGLHTHIYEFSQTIDLVGLLIAGLTPPTLSKVSVSPNPLLAGQPGTLTLSGNNFDAATVQVLVNGPGCAPCTVPNGALMTKTITQVVAPVTLNTSGTYQVSVQNGPSAKASTSLAITIGTPAPTTSSVSPLPNPLVTGQPGTVTVSGNNFNSASVQVLVNGPGCAPCTLPNGVLSTKTTTQVVAPVTLNTAGTYQVSVQNGAGTTVSNSLQIAVGSPVPTITGISSSPNPLLVSQQGTVTINGSNFNAATVQVLVNGPGCAPCTVPNGVLTTKTTTQIAAPVTLNTAGTYNVSVQNGAGTTASNGGPITVGTPAPTISSVSTSPSPLITGQQGSVTINGGNFNTATAQVLVNGPGCAPCIVANGVLTTKTTTRVVVPVTINTAGTYNVSVQNGAGGPASNGQSITVGAVVPTVSSVSPNSVLTGTFDLTINGSNFDSAAIDQIYWKATGALVGNGTILSRSATQIVVREFMSGATPGAYQVRVRNSNGQLSNAVDVNVSAPDPVVNSISPASPVASMSNQTVTVFGSGFRTGLTVTAFFPNNSGSSTLSGTQIQNVTSTSFQMVITVGSRGTWGIRVNNSDAKHSNVFQFTAQ